MRGDDGRTFGIDVEALMRIDIDGGGGVEFGLFPPWAKSEVIVTYSYTPEPGMLALFALGSVVLVRKRGG